MLKPIAIVGGGLAGLTLGVGLRRQGVPVTLWEAGIYPRHRVCGEFISGRGHHALAALGLRERLFEAGAVMARNAMFVLGKFQSPPRRLPQPAISCSRFALDSLLAGAFQEAGGELRASERWQEDGPVEGVVFASGRRAQPHSRGWRWFGLKIHARGLPLRADLEMHSQPSGYLGLTRLKDDEVNVCGLFRRSSSPGERAVSSGRELLRGAPGTELAARLGRAVFDPASFCSVAGLSLQRRRAAEQPECCVGDAVTMTPPVTGNGMSMAFESASLAVAPLAAYSRGELPWMDARQAVARACDRAFGRRLAWARLLQWMMLSPLFQTRFGALALNSESFWRFRFAQTR